MAKLTRQQVTKDNSAQLLKILRFFMIFTILLWMYIIYSFSADTGLESGTLSRYVTDIFNRIVEIIIGRNIKLMISATSYSLLELGIRKLAHMFIYFILCINIMLLLFTFPKINMIMRIIVSLIFCFGYACLDEFHQSFVAGRGASFKDTLIDSSGALLGIIAALILYCIGYTIYHIYQKHKIKQYNASIQSQE